MKNYLLSQGLKHWKNKYFVVSKKSSTFAENKICKIMKTGLLKSLILIGLFFLIAGCETKPIVNQSIEGEWTLVDKKNPFSVVITENMIHAYPNPTKTLSCKYTMSQDYLHIVRLWKSETDVDYTADCKYSFYGDTLVICDYMPTIVATYNDIKLVKVVK